MNDKQQSGFRDPTRLTNWTRSFLCASIVVALVTAGTSTVELLGYRVESPSPLFLLFVVPWAVVMAGIVVTTAVLVLVWIHRANYNARQLGATDMKISPGWAVGWYFVPVAWFWKPYQAMKEIWQASVNPKYWWRQSGSPLLTCWWSLCLLRSWGLPLVYAMVVPSLDTARPETVEAISEVAGEILYVPLTLVLLMIIDRIHSRQMRHFRSQAAAAPAPVEPLQPSSRSSTAVP